MHDHQGDGGDHAPGAQRAYRVLQTGDREIAASLECQNSADQNHHDAGDDEQQDTRPFHETHSAGRSLEVGRGRLGARVKGGILAQSAAH